MIAESGTPDACIFAIFSFAGCEKLQPSMLQLATVSGQPHWQASLAPTRRMSCLTLAICAGADKERIRSAHAAMSGGAASRRPALHRNILLSDTHYLGPRILQLDLARNQRYQGSEDQHDSACPDPADQRKYVRLNDRLIILYLREVQIEIL